MKKLFTVVMALMISASAFALDVKFDSISLHFAVPFCYENSERTGSKVETNAVYCFPGYSCDSSLY